MLADTHRNEEVLTANSALFPETEMQRCRPYDTQV